MADYKIIVGDWSEDGHGKKETYVVSIPDHFSALDLKANYQHNVDTFGFSPMSICQNYQGRGIFEEYAYKLFKAGLPMDGKAINGDKYEVNYFYTSQSNLFDQESDEDEYQDEFYLDNTYVNGPQGMLHLCMFFIGHGLTDFTWEQKDAMIPVLFGANEAIIDNGEGGSSHLGYGLYE